ncbi:MAG TPA: phosphatase PAP2 family protein [Solirubrobacteraceae bacterium]|nr:phosphatase PAP2 family protein [Solirubrobacteraceae bacterium]
MGIPSRARTAFIGVGLGLIALAGTWYAAHEVARLRSVDVNVLLGFLELNRPQLDWIANGLVWLCDPTHYVVLAAIPVLIALLRGRRRVAVAALALLAGANASTELLKPLLGGPRDQVPGIALGHATWPSGHSTASMTLALALIVCVPSRWRPVVSALGALFTLGVVYSLLALGAHYPSDVLGGFGMAAVWTLFVLGVLWTYEAHRPALVARLSAAGARLTPAQALAPTLVAVVGILAAGGLVLALRPRALVDFAGSHPAFLTGACALAALSFGGAAGLSLLLGRSPGPRSGSGRAPTEAHRPRPPRSLPG